MSNLITLKNTSNVPARADRRTSRLADKISTGGSLRRLATNTNGTFKRIVGGEQIGKAIPHQIDVIIVDMLPGVSREYYASDYDPENQTLPDCWSNDGKTPDAKATNKQADSCAQCRMNVDGSASRGKGKACRFKRRLAVLAEGDPTGEVYQLSVASKSLFGKSSGPTYPFESYCKYLKSNGEAPDTLVTRVAYDLDADTLTLNFREVRFLTEEEEAMVDAAYKDPETKRYTQLTPAEVDGVKTQPARMAIAAPPPKPVASVEPDDEDEEPAPVARVAKKAAPVEPSPADDVHSVLDEWADEE
jgi:hypothetical protein